MCGIVGYIGGRDAVSVLMDGLRRLEYRGYDSAGLAVLNGQGLMVVKTAGKLARLGERVKQLPGLGGGVGIGHTRWATHGEPTDENAHPHTDCSRRVAVVHNGIIENYRELRHWLTAQGHRLLSDTDTEVLPHLVEHYYQGDLLAAVLRAVRHLEGSYALAVLCEDEPDRIVALRKDSPLVVGLGRGENYLASDIPALLPYTRRTLVLSDLEVVDLRRNRVRVLDWEGRPLQKEVLAVNWDPQAAEKGGYPHFMLKEIYEQPQAARDALRGRLDLETGWVRLPELDAHQERLSRVRKVVLVACGTAYHAGLVGRRLIENLAGLPAQAELASEFRYQDPLIDPNTLVVLISQSGETADTLAALREVRRRGALALGVVNVVGSSIAREAEAVLYTRAGPEIAVASTKAYVTQVLVLTLLALYLRQLRQEPQEGDRPGVRALSEIPSRLEQALELADRVRELVPVFEAHPSCFFIGRGLDYPVAMEGALKLKEISYLHAEAYAAGELKHGPLALIQPGLPVVTLSTQPQLRDKTVSNAKEVKARGGYVLALTGAEGQAAWAEVADAALALPEVPGWLAPAVAVVPLQLLAYHVAVALGCDVDQPRNLAKSVTVE
ncbi:MAG: glutamine--fructose-6-phosphate transaminase (isomerizing) [Moorellales bacterium]